MLKFQYRYFIFTIIIFLVEVFIALFVHDEIIRPHIGDLLVVILIYCFLKSFLNIAVGKIARFTLLFSYTVETLQYFKIVELLGLGHSKIARIIIGTSFSWMDIVAYTLGIGIVLIIEKFTTRRKELITEKKVEIIETGIE
ncbi:MAG: DUF2809 domain-containing protein [Ferruginibacter sp.]